MNDTSDAASFFVAKAIIEKATDQIAELAERTAIQFKALDGERALLAFAAAIREINSEMFPTTGTKK